MRFILSAALTTFAFAAHAQPPATPPAPPKAPLTQDNGRPVGDNQNSRTAGENGPLLLDDFHLIEKLARFDRERIPERVVHARGAGAHGEFECTADFSAVSKAKLFGEAGKKTPVFVRFSTVIHPKGSAEQLRDPRGFAVKFYTEEGNWDLVGNNLPVFFIRDALKFPDLIHSLKPSPITNQQDNHRIFDFLSHVPESTHMITFLWSDRGTPKNYREQEGFGVNTFKLVNAKGEASYAKFNWRSMQGIKTNTQEESEAAAGKNAGGFTADLYGAIGAGKFPSWELRVQVIKPDQLDAFDFNPLDDTKVWPDVPETTVGKMTLNRVPSNFFQFTEQVAFCPGVMVPGVEASEDKMLQGRVFSYSDTQRYRVGTNFMMLPVNRPLSAAVNNNQDGKLNFGVTEKDVNYEPSIETGPPLDNKPTEISKTSPTGRVIQQAVAKTLNFKQAGMQYRTFTEGERTNLVKNLSHDLNDARAPVIKERIVAFLLQADEEYGTRVAEAVGVKVADARKHFEKPAGGK